MPLRLERNQAVIVCLCLCLCWSCAGPGKRIEIPRVSLANIRLEKIRAFESVFLLELRVLNTNDVAIEIKGIDCEVQLNDRQFASGVSDQITEITPHGTATIPITVYTSVIDIAEGIFGLSQEKKLRYRVKGRLHLGGGFLIPPVIPFESDGEVYLKPHET
jgi:LEA14-like dessication related protein